MAASYSADLRERVLNAINAGMARRRAGALFSVSASTAVRWAKEFAGTGSRAAKPTGGDRRSEALEGHKDWLLAVVASEPDLTLKEIGARLADEKSVTTSKSAVSRFLERHRIRFKKKPARRRAGP
jgi:transposase